MPLAEQQEPSWGGRQPEVGAREVWRGSSWPAGVERQELWLGLGCGGGLGLPLLGLTAFSRVCRSGHCWGPGALWSAACWRAPCSWAPGASCSTATCG